MSFGDLKTRSGQQELNNYLAARSYLDGYFIQIFRTGYRFFNTFKIKVMFPLNLIYKYLSC